jgi:hypothetical protein
MESDAGEGIYRAMIEDTDGMPMLGLVAVKLGVRRGIDIMPDQQDLVHRPVFRPGDPNGLSCAPTIHDLPQFALSVEWGGSNRRTVVWRIESFNLGSELVAREDTVPQSRARHISVGPSGTMTFDDYLCAVQATRARWKKIMKR